MKLPNDFKQLTPARGQSLVEIALFLPILFFLLAGIVEVGNLLITQNRVTTAARSGAGYGASNYVRDDWDGTAQAMGIVALNTVTETLDLSESVWDVWSVHAETNDTGDGFDTFVASHVYGNHSVVSEANWATIEPVVEADMLAELQATGIDSAQNLEVVASVAYHHIGSILGFPVWQWLGVQHIRGFTVMRVDQLPPYTGCPLLPISVHLNQYSLYPSNWTPGVQLNPSLYPGDGVALFPVVNGPTGFEYPSPAPLYENRTTSPALKANNFGQNWPGVPLRDARSGYLYWAREEGPSGSFGWLSWRPPASAANLRESLTYPGNHLDPITGYPFSPADLGTTGDPPGSSTGNQNGTLEIGEWVENSTGNISSAEGIIRGYVNSKTPVTIILSDKTNGKTGENANYHVAGFLSARILGYSFQGSGEDKWILFEFVSWKKACVFE